MNIKELTEYIVLSIVRDKDNVTVNVEQMADKLTTVNIFVTDSDLGMLIGKSGKVANAIRTVIQAAGYANNKKNIKINIDKSN